MPVGLFHGFENAIDERPRNLLMEKIAHGIHKNHPRPFPRQRLLKSLCPQRKVEPVLKRVSCYAAPTFRKSGRIAIVAAGRDLRTACNRIPCSVGPFDCTAIGHKKHTPERNMNLLYCTSRRNKIDRRAARLFGSSDTQAPNCDGRCLRSCNLIEVTEKVIFLHSPALPNSRPCRIIRPASLPLARTVRPLPKAAPPARLCCVWASSFFFAWTVVQAVHDSG